MIKIKFLFKTINQLLSKKITQPYNKFKLNLCSSQSLNIFHFNRSLSLFPLHSPSSPPLIISNSNSLNLLPFKKSQHHHRLNLPNYPSQSRNPLQKRILFRFSRLGNQKSKSHNNYLALNPQIHNLTLNNKSQRQFILMSPKSKNSVYHARSCIK